jgi:hypothetical protein
VEARKLPWIDWQNYWATGDASSRSGSLTTHLSPNGRGVDGALLDLEYQRIELIKLNLFDTSGTYEAYVLGRDGVGGPALKVWPQMRLPKGYPQYEAVGGEQTQVCAGDLIRARTLTGICNDLKNPLMGSSHMPFARNVQFEVTFPELSLEQLTRNRHGDRLGPLTPDPQVISRRLFTRAQSQPDRCHEGHGLPGSPTDASCDYKKAPFFNVLAAFWIQFMTHDRFSHLQEGHNVPGLMPVGCPSEAAGCRPGDRIDPGYVAQSGTPPRFRRRQGSSEPAREDDREHGHRVVGRLADLRLRRDLAPPREARSRRSGQLLLSPIGQRGAGDARATCRCSRRRIR